MNDAEAKSYNALAMYLRGDYRKLSALKETHTTWTEAYETLRKAAPDSDRAWEDLQKKSIRLILATDPNFPELLKEIPWPPHALYIRGADIDSQKKLAIVGTRKATTAGLAIANTFSQELSRAGLTIVSGLALGIDAAAHQGALAAKGKTIAVLACGLDTVYPRQNERIAAEILTTGGSLVSEYPVQSATFQKNFLERNRITSGLCDGVVIIESPLRSGVRSTARYAIEQNRDVLVVPGTISHPNYMGSHQLIRSGAQLVTSSTEILEHFGMKPRSSQTLFSDSQFDKLEKKHKIIIRALSESGMPLTPDELSDATKLSPQEIAEALTLLLVDGIIKEESGTYFIV